MLARLFRSAALALALAAMAPTFDGRTIGSADASAAPAMRELPAIGVDLSATTVSGISSGAYMAGQFQFAHADIVIGTAIVAGGPYGCAESAFSGFAFGPAAVMLNFNQAVTGCMLGAMQAFGVPNPTALAQRARRRAEAGEIGSIAAVASDRVYLFSGSRDQLVAPAIVRATAAFYAALGVAQDRIRLVDTVPAGHGFVTEAAGAQCGATRTPYVVDCDLDLAGEILGYLTGRLAPAADPAAEGEFVSFDQFPFAAGLNRTGLASEGAVYVPRACREREACRVHIAFHGCGQGKTAVGDAFIVQSGFARWAAANRLVVLYPQVEASSMNPQGCWDWWGYTGPKFLTRMAPQIVAVRRMIDALAQRR